MTLYCVKISFKGSGKFDIPHMPLIVGGVMGFADLIGSSSRDLF
jgi:hypothetical protein